MGGVEFHTFGHRPIGNGHSTVCDFSFSRFFDPEIRRKVLLKSEKVCVLHFW